MLVLLFVALLSQCGLLGLDRLVKHFDFRIVGPDGVHNGFDPLFPLVRRLSTEHVGLVTGLDHGAVWVRLAPFDPTVPVRPRNLEAETSSVFIGDAIDLKVNAIVEFILQSSKWPISVNRMVKF